MIMLVFLAIILSVAVGVIRKVNIGPLALICGLLLGILGLQLKSRAILSSIPITLIFNVVAVTMFYGYARINGTLSKIVEHILYRIRNKPMLVPIIVFLLTAVIAVMGVGIFAGLFVAPIAYELGKKAKHNTILMYICLACGSIMGSNYPYSLGGILVRSFIEQSPYAEEAMAITVKGSIMTALVCTFMVIIGHFIYRGEKIDKIEMSLPVGLESKQKITLWLIIIITTLAVVPVTLNVLMHAPLTQLLASITEIGTVCTLGIVIASLLNLADSNLVVQKTIPWNTIILVAGFSVLLFVAQEAGVMKFLSDVMSNSIPTSLLEMAMIVIGGTMSFFASGLTVVMPILYKIIPDLATQTGASAPMLYALVFAAVSATATSPISGVGNSILGGIEDPKEQVKLFYKVFPIPIYMFILTIIVSLFF